MEKHQIKHVLNVLIHVLHVLKHQLLVHHVNRIQYNLIYLIKVVNKNVTMDIIQILLMGNVNYVLFHVFGVYLNINAHHVLIHHNFYMVHHV